MTWLGLICTSASSSDICIKTRTRGFPEEHWIIRRWLLSFPLSISPWNVVADQCMLFQVITVHVWQVESTEGYWCELNVDGVIEGQPALQIHQLFVVLTPRCLHHIVHVEHPRLPAVRHDHHTQVWQPGRPETRMLRLHPQNHSRRTRTVNLTLEPSNLELLIMPTWVESISGQICLSISQKCCVLNWLGQTTALHWTCTWQVSSTGFTLLKTEICHCRYSSNVVM